MKISVVASRSHVAAGVGDDWRAEDFCDRHLSARDHLADSSECRSGGATNAKRKSENGGRAGASKDATHLGSFSTGRLPHMNSEKNDGSTAHSHDLSRVTNKFCQNISKMGLGDIQIQTLRTTCAGHESMARPLPMIQA